MARSRFRKAGKILLVLIVIGAILYLLSRFFLSSSFLTPRIERVASRELNAQCRMQGFNFRLLGRPTVREFRLALPGSELSRPFARLRGLELSHDASALLTGAYRLNSVAIDYVDFSLTPEVLEWIDALKEKRAGMEEPLPLVQVFGGRILVNLPQLAEDLEITRLNSQVAEDGAGIIRGAASFAVDSTRVRAKVEAQSWSGEAAVHLQIPGARLEKAPRLSPSLLPDVLKKLDVSGVVSGALSLWFNTQEDLIDSCTGNFTFDSIRLTNPDWPVSVSGLSGECRLTEGAILFEDVAGRVQGAALRIDRAQVTLKDGRVNRLSARGAVVGLDLASLSTLDLPPEIASSISRAGIKSGVADVEFDYLQTAEGERNGSATVAIRDGEFQPEEFPVGLKNVQAELRVPSEDVVHIRRARGRLGEGAVTVSGFLRRGPDEGWMPEVEVHLEDLPLTPGLLKRLPPDARHVVEELGVVGGYAGGRMYCLGEVLTAEGRVRGVTIKPRQVPYALRDLTAAFHWSSRSDNAYLWDLAARHDGGTLEGRGSINLKKRPRVDLVLHCQDLPLDQELCELLPQKARTIWQEWDPEGSFDLSLHLRDKALDGDADLEKLLAGVDAAVRLRNVSLWNQAHDMRIRGLEGGITAKENVINLRDVSGEVLGLHLETEGQISLGPEGTRARIRVQSARTRLTPKLAREWPDFVADPVLNAGADADFEFHADLMQEVGQEGLVANVVLTLHELRCRAGKVPLEGTGTARATVTAEPDGDLDCRGRLVLRRGQADQFRVSDLVAELSYSHGTLTLPRADLTAYGGLVELTEGRLDVEDGTWQIKGRLSHLDLESIVAALGVEGRDAPAGSMRGTLEMEGRRLEKSALRGSGEVKVDRGRLYELPIIVTVLNFFDLRLPRESPVSDAYAAFHVEEGTMRLDDLLLAGGSVPVHMRGTVGLKEGVPMTDQEINLVVSVPQRRGILDEIPIINWIKHLTIDQLRRLVLQANVVGTVGDYHVSSTLQPITAPISSMWNLLQQVSPRQTEQFMGR